MTKIQSNIKYLVNLIKYTRKTDEQLDLINQVIDHYASSRIHKLITAEKMINQLMNTKTSCKSVVKQLPNLEAKEPVYKTINQLIQFITIKEQPCILDGLICTELPNVEVLDKLLNSDLLNTVSYEKKMDSENNTKMKENILNHIDQKLIKRIKFLLNTKNIVV